MMDKIYRLSEVVEITGLGKTTIYRKAKDPNDRFPKPVKIGAKASGWRESELQAWIDSL